MSVEDMTPEERKKLFSEFPSEEEMNRATKWKFRVPKVPTSIWLLVVSIISLGTGLTAGYQIGSKRAVEVAVVTDDTEVVDASDSVQMDEVTAPETLVSATSVVEETSPNVVPYPTYIVVEGDTVSEIAVSECGAYSMTKVVEDLNGLKPGYLLQIGQELHLPCELQEVTKDIVEKTVSTDASVVPVETLVTVEGAVPEKKTVEEAVEATAPKETVVETEETPEPAEPVTVIEEEETPKTIRKGMYELIILHDAIPGIMEGSQPSFYFSEAEGGQVGIQKGDVTVSTTEDGRLQLKMPIEESTKTVAFDYGGNKPVEIDVGFIMEYGNVIQGEEPIFNNLDEKRYKRLEKYYFPKPNFLARAFKVVMSRKKDILIYSAGIGLAIPTAGASFTTIGWPAIGRFVLPEAVKFTARRAMRAQDQGMRLMNQALNQQEKK